MKAVPLTSRGEITHASEELYAALRRGARDEGDGFFSSKTGSYSFYRSEENRVRHIFVLYAPDSYVPTVVFSFWRAKPSKALGGLLLRMPDGGVGMAHSGRLSTGKNKFVSWYRRRYGEDRSLLVEWPDRREAKYILIGQPGKSDFQARVAQYVAAVERYKRGPRPAPSKPRGVSAAYVPHTVRTSTGFATRAPRIVVRRRHNAVVAALARLLLGGGKENPLRYDRERDLFVAGKGGVAKMLFEVKTDCDRQTLYTGLGQLMLHGAAAGRQPVRVLVIPDELDDDTKGRLERLGVRVLRYSMTNKRPCFSPRAVGALMA